MNLIEKHGTLKEFTAACDSAFNQLFITWEERNTAVEKYRKELEDEARSNQIY